MKILRNTLIAFAVVLILLVGISFFRFSQKANQSFGRPAFSIAAEVKTAEVALGKRIFTVRAGCVDCHGEGGAGVKVMENGAMGSIFGSNITPFRLSSWSDEEIAGAIRYGIHREGRSLRFMPAFDFVTLSKSDIAAVIAYLRTLKPVNQASHVNTYGPMARILAAWGKMPVMFPAFAIDQAQGFAAKPEEKLGREFGQYLAGSCVGCHGSNYEGGKIPGGDPAWPAASNIRLGARPDVWTESKFKAIILTGKSALTGEPIRAPMPVHLLKQLDDTEISSLWIFLSGLK
jgi:mono/diheme cytochrome c family protein